MKDRRTPPGQECSNGSQLSLAVVPWHLFSSAGSLDSCFRYDQKQL